MAVSPAEVLLQQLNKARDGLREIDENLRGLAGRGGAPIETNRGGRFGGPRGGVGGRFQGPTRLFQAARQEIVEEDARTLAVKRRFTAVGGEETEDIDRKRYRESGTVSSTSVSVRRNTADAAPPRPVISSTVVPAPRDEKSRDEAINLLKGTEVREVQQRNRRMFGVLMGTLQQFKKDETRTFRDQEKKQKEVEQKLEEKKKQERERVENERRELLQKRREQSMEIGKIYRRMMLIELESEWETHTRKLQNYIQTQAKPPIFYMPAKHTMRTIELQKKSAKRIEEMIQHRKDRLKQELEDIDKPRAPRGDRIGGFGGRGGRGGIRSAVEGTLSRPAAERGLRERRPSGSEEEEDEDDVGEPPEDFKPAPDDDGEGIANCSVGPDSAVKNERDANGESAAPDGDVDMSSTKADESVGEAAL